MKQRVIKFTLLLAVVLSTFAIQAQNTPIVTIAIPELRSNLPSGLFQSFEDQWGVEVVVIESLTDVYLPSEANDVQAYLDALHTYAQRADVLYVNGTALTATASRTGFLANLEPLARSDAALNPDEYQQAAWQSVTWDGGLWALPASFDTSIFAYNMAAFDAANLPYPSPAWTMDDFANAVRALTVRDDSGNVIHPGFEAVSTPVDLLLAFANTSLSDLSLFPAQPNLAQESLATVFNTWRTLQDEGVIGRPVSNMAGTVQTLRVFSSAEFRINPNARAGLLPNNRAGIHLSGYAVSAGSGDITLAYELAKFASQSAVLHTTEFAAYHAYQPQATPPVFATDVQPILDQALNSVVALPNKHYSDYVTQALNTTDDPLLALANAQTQAADHLQTAQTYGRNTSLAVNVPAFVATDGVTLRFGVATTVAPLPNQAQWDDAIAQFVASDPDVGNIQLETLFSQPDTQQLDCFAYLGSVLNRLPRAELLPLSPLMDVDADFMPQDFIVSVLERERRDGLIYGYPVAITPRLLRYDKALLEASGAILPDTTWTVQSFMDTAQQINQTMNVSGYTVGNTLSLMALVTAYGGQPLDLTVQPPLVSFTEEATINALQQVVNAIQSGAFAHQLLANPVGMGGQVLSALQPFALSSQFGSTFTDADGLVNYPSDNGVAVVSYGTVTLYISANTPYPDACYRWLNHISLSPAIYSALPTRLSQLDLMQRDNLISDAEAAILRDYVDLLQRPDVTVVSNVIPIGNTDEAVLQFWFNRAVDRAVLENADLRTELSAAQANADSYLQCRSDGTSVADCALLVDNTTQAILR